MPIEDILADYDTIGEAIYMEYYDQDNDITDDLSNEQLEEALDNLIAMESDAIKHDYIYELREVITNVEFELEKRYKD